jgi:hypothetical protein
MAKPAYELPEIDPNIEKEVEYEEVLWRWQEALADLAFRRGKLEQSRSAMLDDGQAMRLAIASFNTLSSDLLARWEALPQEARAHMGPPFLYDREM